MAQPETGLAYPEVSTSALLQPLQGLLSPFQPLQPLGCLQNQSYSVILHHNKSRTNADVCFILSLFFNLKYIVTILTTV